MVFTFVVYSLSPLVVLGYVESENGIIYRFDKGP